MQVHVDPATAPSIQSERVFTIAMWGMVVSLWIALVGLFIVAIVHDGTIVPTVVDTAGKLVSAVIIALTTLGGLHVFVTRPVTPPAGASPPSQTAPATATATGT